jgi:cellobiose-specific phosphotransferase system component IIB
MAELGGMCASLLAKKMKTSGEMGGGGAREE